MSKSIRVLHVEDDADLAEVTADMLERAHDDLYVTPVSSASAALDLLESDVDAIDCLVSDYDMSEMNGLDLLSCVRRHRPELPFILFTGKGSEEVAADALSAGANDYLQKAGGESQYQVLANRIENAVDRYRARQASAKANRHRRQVLDRITDGYARLDEDLTILDVNEATAEFVGSTPRSLIGSNYRELIDTDSSSIILYAYEAVLESGEPQTIESVSAVRPNRWVEERVFPADDGGLHIYFHDITEQKRRERDLEAERDRLSAIFEAVPEPLIHTTFEDGAPVIQRVNAAFETEFGYDAETAVNTSINELIVPDERLDETRTLDADSFEHDRISAEVWRETTDGERLFRFSAASIGSESSNQEWIATYIDITDANRRERALERQRANLERLHEAANRLYAAGTVADCYDITIEAGISILGFDWCTLAAPADDDPTMFEIRAISEGTPIDVGDRPFGVDEGIAGQVYQDKQPSIIDNAQEAPNAKPTSEVIRSVLTVPVGDWGIFQAISTDPSAFADHDRHHAELLVSSMLTAVDRINQQRELRRQRDRLDEFASVVSHDLRSPLAVADGRIELAREQHDNEHLIEAAGAIDRMDDLIEDLLTLAREGETVGEQERIELDSLVAECWQTISSTDSTVDIQGSVSLRGDRRRLRQLLENLFRNAVEHGGDDVAITVGTIDDGFFVEDDGPGIPPERREDIFETGYTTDDSGTGFGLGIVKRIVDAHGWNVQVTEGVAGGARFEITGIDVAP